MKKSILSLFLATALLVISGAAAFAQIAKTPQKNSKEMATVKPLPNKQVCMITNKFMSKDQIAVPVNDKTYYGCCQGCVGTLKNDANSRLATDALTNQKVDKASAFIIVKPGTKDDVLYFASKENATAYVQQQSKK